MNTDALKAMANHLRRQTMKMIYEDKDGHPSPSLSIAEIVSVLYFDVMRIDPSNPSWEDRDRLILSKGHACPIIYAALNERGYFGRKLEHFMLRELGSAFQGHPVMGKTPGIDFTSGSLGNGIAIGTGMGIAGKLHNKDFTVFVICGDGELEEGIVWEGINAAAAHRLDNLIVLVDKNNMQSGGRVDSIIAKNNIKERFEAFCWDVQELENGHEIGALRNALHQAKENKNGKPKAIICNDIKGKGVDFIEADNSWHKRVPTEEEFKSIMKQLGGEK